MQSTTPDSNDQMQATTTNSPLMLRCIKIAYVMQWNLPASERVFDMVARRVDEYTILVPGSTLDSRWLLYGRQCGKTLRADRQN